MVKSEKGVTLLILVITIIIIFILLGVSVNTGYSALNNIRAGRVIANLNLIKIKVDDIYDDYQYNDDETLLVGVNDQTYTLEQIVSSNEMNGIQSEFDDYNSIKTEENWYEWNKNTLKSQGLDTKILDDGGKIFVNYETGEIIFTNGATMNNEEFYYTLSGIKAEFENE